MLAYLSVLLFSLPPCLGQLLPMGETSARTNPGNHLGALPFVPEEFRARGPVVDVTNDTDAVNVVDGIVREVLGGAGVRL